MLDRLAGLGQDNTISDGARRQFSYDLQLSA
jgi:hypothetical protein